MSGLDVNRRDFMKIAAETGAALAMPSIGHTAVSSKMIGIQIGAVSFVDEGTERVLDMLHERGGVNTLFLAVFTYGRGIAGRQIPGQLCPITASKSTTSIITAGTSQRLILSTTGTLSSRPPTRPITAISTSLQKSFLPQKGAG
jgi:hypothetical protein